MSDGAPRPRLLQTSAGRLSEAFGAPEWGLLTALAFMWGSSFLFIDIGLEALRPGVVTLARVALGAAAVALVSRARRRVAREDLPRVALLGVVWIGIPLTLFPIAQQWVDSSVAGMMNAAMPIFTAVWATALLRRLPGSRQVVGLLLGFVGVLSIMWPGLGDADATALGTALLLVAVCLYGLAANLAVPLQQRYGSLPVLLHAQVAALVIVTPLGLVQLPGSEWAWGSALAMVPLGVLGTGLAFVLMTTLVGRVGGPRGSVAIYFTPIVAIVLGVALRGEPLHATALVGTALVLAGAWLASRRET
ncbi:DMT family transporter [Egibacter rhizosphaerae]|uniref:DMT family transporter n=1 Tax=Egibacter rhizosphaerae TaxID=1670831 RepID=A0A411YF69_9ACTN|nr:DMT family transporter [Egibacter rhizosphaerae]QBI19762.1 DMT family transporter [Egibacter rhizosphaerae]